jgi:PTH1 family peptidyl-tRNA hydrolase
MKVIVGLGNPGPEYEATRHNVGWWAVDRISQEWNLGPFEQQGRALVAEGTAAGAKIRLVKPLTYMNRSGQALTGLASLVGFEVSHDLLVVVDDTALEVGRLRVRKKGGTGGHNGLESVTQAIGHGQYARARLGVGQCPPGIRLSDWVLSEMEADEEEAVLSALTVATDAARVWVKEGIEAAMNRFNR